MLMNNPFIVAAFLSAAALILTKADPNPPVAAGAISSVAADPSSPVVADPSPPVAADSSSPVAADPSPPVAADPVTKSTGGPKIDRFAGIITRSLLTSKVLKESAHFTLTSPYNILLNIGNNLLAKAGQVNPLLAQIAALAGEAVYKVPSRLYFQTFGYEVAKFLDLNGLLTEGNVQLFANMIVKSVELEACQNGHSSPEEVGNAVVYGLFDVMKQFKLVGPDSMAKLFYLFAYEILTQSGKFSPLEVSVHLRGILKI